MAVNGLANTKMEQSLSDAYSATMGCSNVSEGRLTFYIAASHTKYTIPSELHYCKSLLLAYTSNRRALGDILMVGEL